MAKIYTGGTFDLFHSGHVSFLRQCHNISRLVSPFSYNPMYPSSTKVVVSLNSDSFIYQYKGKYPVYSFEERKEILLGCKYVDEVVQNVMGRDSKPSILAVKPDFIVVGSDWASKDYYKQMGFTQEWLDRQNIGLIYVPYTEGISTTQLKERICG